MQSVYIETTIPSYYFETRRSPTVVAWRTQTRQWWDRWRGVLNERLGLHVPVVTTPLTLIPEDR